MAVTLNAIDIETLISINEINRPKIASTPFGYHGLALNQQLKGTLHQYQVNCVWSGGNSDFTAKKSKVQNMVDAGLPVWFDATEWQTNQMIFGRVSDLNIILSEGRVNVWDVSFLITAVFPWGYTFIVDDGNGDFRIYDTDKVVQSRALNPLIRLCGLSMTSFTSLPATYVYSFYVKNIGSTGIVKVELMVPDGLTTGSVSTNVVTTKAHGNLGDAGISNTPGTKRRITLSKSVTGGVEELWTVTISIGSLKTSFIDGSIDDIAA